MLSDKNFWWGFVIAAIVSPWAFNRFIGPAAKRMNGNGR